MCSDGITCCCCFRIETGTYVVAILDLFWELFILFVFLMTMQVTVLSWYDQIAFFFTITRIISIYVLIAGIFSRNAEHFWMWILTKLAFLFVLTSSLFFMCILSLVEWDNLEYIYARSSFILVFTGVLGESLILWTVLDVSFSVLNAIYLDTVLLMRKKIQDSMEEATDFSVV